MSPEKIISRQTLENGLTLEVWDLSRPVLGDRWQVVLEVRVPIPVNAATLPPELAGREEAVRAALGPQILFVKREERQFIAASQMKEVLQEMHDRLSATLTGYLGRPGFAPGYIRKTFAQQQERQQWSKQ
jgi:hypothetical protein